MSERPPTPPTGIPCPPEEERFDSLGMYMAECVENYRPGGFAPVTIGDRFKDDRYRVLRKLGYGSFSTVWLAHNTSDNCMVALKVGVADSAETNKEASIYRRLNLRPDDKVVRCLAMFQHNSPNGNHPCLVYELMGPNWQWMTDYPPPIVESGKYSQLHMAKKAIKDMLLGIHVLHAHSIVHSDLQPGNILIKAPSLSTNRCTEFTQQVPGDEDNSSLVRRKDGKTDFWAPQYILSSLPLCEEVELGTKFEARLSDLGSAFVVGETPAEIFTPVALRSPEAILKLPITEKIDIWSFGCLVFELLTECHLFQFWMTPSDDEHILMMIDVLGQLPEELKASWPRYDRYFGPNGEVIRTDPIDYNDGDDDTGNKEDIDRTPNADPKVDKAGEPSHEEHPQREDSQRVGEAHKAGGKVDSETILDARETAKQNGDSQIEEMRHEDVPRLDEVNEDGLEEAEIDEEDTLEDLWRRARPSLPDIDDEEYQQILALLKRILQYRAEDRPSAADLLQDPWIRSI